MRLTLSTYGDSHQSQRLVNREARPGASTPRVIPAHISSRQPSIATQTLENHQKGSKMAKEVSRPHRKGENEKKRKKEKKKEKPLNTKPRKKKQKKKTVDGREEDQ